MVSIRLRITNSGAKLARRHNVKILRLIEQNISQRRWVKSARPIVVGFDIRCEASKFAGTPFISLDSLLTRIGGVHCIQGVSRFAKKKKLGVALPRSHSEALALIPRPLRSAPSHPVDENIPGLGLIPFLHTSPASTVCVLSRCLTAPVLRKAHTHEDTASYNR